MKNEEFATARRCYNILTMRTDSQGRGMTKTMRWMCAALFMLHASCFISCSDFFDTDPKNIINEDDYIAKEDEMYKGMLGIMNRVQEAGDQAIWLTDTRCNYLEVTSNAPNALKDIYNYEPTQGNEYADPTCYYAIIIACNDYLHKMAEYHHSVGGMSEGAETNFRALLSSALRIKVWAYYTLGRIYGKACWFDDPLTEMKDRQDRIIIDNIEKGKQKKTAAIKALTKKK